MFWNDFHFDSLTAAYLTVGLLIMLLAAWYGRKTMDGRQWPKFGYAVMLFCIGYCLTILSGSTKALVIGWELMGIASFLCMIPHRNLATGNSAKAFFIYRLGDVGLLLAMWASHHLWRENTALISFLLLATASAQSSQLPLSSWLPQAMDASSAAGAMLLAALVVQMGVFLLLRSMPLWEHQLSVRILIASLGTATAALATGFARVEPSMKRRIAFASMAQVGLIFIEVAAGFKEIAMAHVGGNALLRAYQLIISRGLTSIGIRKHNAISWTETWEDRLPKRLQYTLYVLYIKEWGVYTRLSRYLKS